MNKQSIKKNKTVKKTNKIKSVKKDKTTKKERLAAIIGLIVLTIFLIGLVVALITANGKLTMAMIFSLTFVSILLFVVLRLYK